MGTTARQRANARERERERSSISPSREEGQDPIVDNAFSLSLHTRIRVRTRIESKGIYKSFFIFGPVWLCYRYLDAFPSCPDLSIYARLAGIGGREGERKIEYLLARGSNKREKGSSKSGASLTREEEGDAKKRERERASMYREAHSLSPVASLFGDFAIAAATRTPT